MEIIIVMSLALNVVLYLIICSIKRKVQYDEKSIITLLIALDKLNGITKSVYKGNNLSLSDENFLMALDLELALEKERQKSKLQA